MYKRFKFVWKYIFQDSRGHKTQHKFLEAANRSNFGFKPAEKIWAPWGLRNFQKISPRNAYVHGINFCEDPYLKEYWVNNCTKCTNACTKWPWLYVFARVSAACSIVQTTQELKTLIFGGRNRVSHYTFLSGYQLWIWPILHIQSWFGSSPLFVPVPFMHNISSIF